MSILISCETGGDRGAAWEPKLAGKQSRGDWNARHAAETLADCLDADLLINEYCPDLIDVSRSLRHRDLFSPLTKALPDKTKQSLVDHIHQPYRRKARDAIASILLRNQYCMHFSVRTYDATWKGKYRRGDVGLGYDTTRPAEVDVCLDWIDDMYDNLIMLKVRRNFPRRGTVDSVTRAMRAEFSASRYLGIEVQFNRAWVGRELKIRDEVLRGIAESLDYIVQDMRRVPATAPTIDALSKAVAAA